MKRHIRQYVWMMTLCVLTAPTVVNADAREGQIKAALLFQFSRLTAYPASAFASDDAPIVIALLGDVEFKATLERGVAGKKIGNHPVVVKSINSPAEAKGCQVLYIAQGQDEAATLNALSGQPIVTVGESDSFLSNGGIMRFLIQDNKVHFQISTANGDKVGLKFQDKLVALAQPG